MYEGQTLEEARAVGRPEKQFWHVNDEDYRVQEVTGLEAGEKSWWCPEIGEVGYEDINLFVSEEKAKKILRGRLTRQREAIDAALAKLGEGP